VENDGYYIFSADAKGLHGEAPTIAECEQKFARLVELRLLDGLGGIYVGKSSFEFQEESLKVLLKYWEEDGVKVLETFPCEVSVFLESSPYFKDLHHIE
jgi:hypothetical protein